jgi:AAA+ superfamily predicted ATPase
MIYSILRNRGFNEFINNYISEMDDITPFMEVIQNYNAKLRPNAIMRDSLRKSIYDIKYVFLQNPPNTILRSIRSFYDPEKIIESSITFEKINRDLLKNMNVKLCENIIGQDKGKKALVTGLYKGCNKTDDKPIVLLLLGPSGIGKTEAAKEINKSFGGALMRIQFSMLQNQEAYNYVFGSEHSKNCLARDLLERETNIVLIDEFDKGILCLS